jgi:hypothetical protein
MAARAAKWIVVPLSSTHYIEMSRIKDPRQRAEVALTMQALSEYVALTSRELLLRDELRRSIASEFGKAYEAPSPAITGFGYAHAFGQNQVRGHITGNLDQARRHADAAADRVIQGLETKMGYGWRFRPSGIAQDRLQLIEEAMNAAMQFGILRGPQDADIERLRQECGYRPEDSYAVTQAIENREAELARLLAEGEARRERLDDIIAARAMYWDLGDQWARASADLELPVRDVVELGKDTLSRIINGVPIIDVESALRRGNFRNGMYTWSTNDIYDLSFVGTAIVYCDVVLTDNHVRAQLLQQGVDRKYGTLMPRRIEDIAAWLEEIATEATH